MREFDDDCDFSGLTNGCDLALEENTKLRTEYDSIFDGEEKVSNLLKITSDKYTRTTEVIKVSEIVISEPLKLGRAKTTSGLTQSIKELGVANPIHVMTIDSDDIEDNCKYVLLDGVRRLYGAIRNGLTEVTAIIWDFKDKEKGRDISLPLSLILNRNQKRSWSEIWDLYGVIEMQSQVISGSQVTPGTLEFLLQLESGEGMKLKDVMLCDYSEVKEALLSGEKDLDGCYKMLQKLRKDEDKLAREDATGITDTVDGAESVATNTTNTEDGGQLSDQDVLELLEMADSVGDLNVNDDDFDTLNKGVDDAQKVGERHPLDPALKSTVLNRDKFKCKCCGFGGAAALGVLAVHHILPVHVGGKDTLENLTTLCLNHHILLHVAERNGGKLQMTREEFDSYTQEEQNALKKTLKLAKVAVEADKRKNMSIEEVRKATTDSIRHPMPGSGLPDAERAYKEAKLANKVEN